MLYTAVVMAGSLALTTAVVAHAYYLKHQFYPTVVYLTKSSPSMAVLYIQAFVLVFLLGKFMGKVFFGQLRAAEMEHLLERSWYAVTETCLAFTVFRDDFSPRFVALFTLLLFLKCFHWLAEDRVDFMERSPNISWLFHFRIVCEYLASPPPPPWAGSCPSAGAFLPSCPTSTTLWKMGPGFIKVLLYMAFMTIMIKVHTFPLFAIRPMYLAMRQFKKAVTDAIMSRRAIRNMNTLYPDATPEELQAMDNVCIICREEMVTGAKRLPCNHIFHTRWVRNAAPPPFPSSPPFWQPLSGGGEVFIPRRRGVPRANGPPAEEPTLAYPLDFEKFWQAARNNPHDFTAWTELLQYVEQENHLFAARKAFDAFFAHYPYCYGYWKKYADMERRFDCGRETEE
ncbi:E3 ubiquitin-protein ligase synoviolin B, partial [Egretta garzetta]|uniref:E3 ubiquitin-protein ligase synoviolin B n=1 Tax=Egretta garzetta TaxID=188379 RepID=UPI00163CA152